MMTLAETVEAYRFKSGDDVPRWMIDVEPSGPDSYFGSCTFSVDCIVVKVFDRWNVIPAELGTKNLVVVDGSKNCIIFAPFESFSLPVSFFTVRGQHIDKVGQS